MLTNIWLPAFFGVALSFATIIVVRSVGMTSERSLFPSALIAIASFYVVFAIETGQTNIIILNVIVTVVFILMAIIGFVKSLWFVVFGLFAHGVFDAIYAISGMSPAPGWWGMFCIVIDILWALALAALIIQKEVNSRG